MPPTLEVLVIVIPGFFAGVLFMDSIRKIFSDDADLVRRLFAEQPATMIAAATTVGSVIVWGVLSILRVF